MAQRKNGSPMTKRQTNSRTEKSEKSARLTPPEGPSGNEIDVRELQLFRSLDLDNDQHVSYSDLLKALEDVGLRDDDVRLTESLEALGASPEERAFQEALHPEVELPPDRFCQAIRQNILLIERALQGNMIIPDFADFCAEIRQIFEATRANRSGKAASYIPQLDLQEPKVDQYGVALCTLDGQRYAVGDAQEFFSVQSTGKPIVYCLALEEHGTETVHQHVGYEPSGVSFNELTLNKHNRPHNPLINAGSIVCCSLIKLREKQEKLRAGRLTEIDRRGWAGTRLDYIMERWQALCGGEKPRFSSPVYLSERQTADRNFALGYFMRENGAFPEGIELEDVLDFYFQCCAIEVNAETMSVVAATLANGGICPVSGERVFRAETVQYCLSLMSSCGMYDFSGEFAFTIGLPAKSGVSGAVLIVVPNVMGICAWSPRLDAHGNSIRGTDFCQRLVKIFNFHTYDSVTGASNKRDPRLNRIQQQAKQVTELIWAGSKGDLGALQQQVWRGAELNVADYDLRTPLHLAAAEGQAQVIQYFIEQKQKRDDGIELNPRDRWGGTPLDDAYTHGHKDIIELLEQHGGVRGKNSLLRTGSMPPASSVPQADPVATVEMIWAASVGNLRAISRLVARGIPLEIADYDLRTPLHLAAAEGHHRVVEYLLVQGVKPSPKDRWGGTPLDDAVRHGQETVVELLKGKGGRSGEVAVTKQEKMLAGNGHPVTEKQKT